MLPKKSRLTTRDVDRVFRSKKCVFVKGEFFMARVLDGFGARWAVNVSKKLVKSAVMRNRIRRRVFGILPRDFEVKKHVFLNVLVNVEEKGVKTEDLEKDLEKIMGKIAKG